MFTTALWTRKAQELQANPHVACLWHWSQIGRQIHVTGEARLADRALTEELFAERPRSHQLQTLASRQGATVSDLAHVRARLVELERRHDGAAVPCPPDWGAVLVAPETVELWSEADDRLHDRQLYRRTGDRWISERLAP